jgi:broad-specificity NMP kinase
VRWDELTASYPVIVLEGCDGVGKTTLASFLSTTYERTLVRCGRLDDGADLAGQYLAVLDQPGRLVFDRSFVSELVYGPLRDGRSRLTPDQAASLAFALGDRGGVLVHLTAHPKAVAWRLRVRDGYAPALDRISAVLRAYCSVFAGLAGAAPIVTVDTTRLPPPADL